MKTIKIIALIFLVISCWSCEEEYHVTVKNSLSNSIMEDVYLGRDHLGSYLAPGDSVVEVITRSKKEDAPAGNLTFRLRAGGKFSNLRTLKSYVVGEGGKLKVVLTDDDGVRRQ